MQNIFMISCLILIPLTIIGCKSKSNDPVGSTTDPYVYETPEDPEAPYVPEHWQQWIRYNHNLITSLSSENFADLEFLDTFLQNKTIVQMGEVAHGIAEQNRLRVRLIKYLHQRLGFDVVVFESGFYECAMMNDQIVNLPSLSALKNSLYSFWHTSDLLDLYEYLKQSRSSINELMIGGIDIQPTGDYVRTRPQFFRNIIHSVDSLFAQRVCHTDSSLLARSYGLNLMKVC
jgi:erythromycin esterase-like protein